VTAGTVGFPLGRFEGFAALAAVTWASYSSLLGYWGGTVFQESIVRALIAAFVVAGSITAITELIRGVHKRRRGGERREDDSAATSVSPASKG
jgi:membrane-associated protein